MFNPVLCSYIAIDNRWCLLIWSLSIFIDRLKQVNRRCTFCKRHSVVVSVVSTARTLGNFTMSWPLACVSIAGTPHPPSSPWGTISWNMVGKQVPALGYVLCVDEKNYLVVLEVNSMLTGYTQSKMSCQKKVKWSLSWLCSMLFFSCRYPAVHQRLSAFSPYDVKC